MTGARRGRRVVVVGDVMLDRDVTGRSTRLSPDAPVPVVDVDRIFAGPGGAGLAALLCVRDAGRDDEVVLLAPVANDPAGDELVLGLTATGRVAVERLGHAGPTRTKTRVRSSGQSVVRIDDGGPATPVDVDARHVERVLAGADAVLVADYGAGTTHDPVVRRALERFALDRPVVWDPHPRGGAPVSGCTLVTPNAAEAAGALAAAGLAAAGLAPAPSAFAAALRERWAAGAVAVTAGRDGAWLATGDGVSKVPALPADGNDPCGAGDRFSSAAALALARGADVEAAVSTAVATAARWVAAGGAAAWRAAGSAHEVVGAAGDDTGQPPADGSADSDADGHAVDALDGGAGTDGLAAGAAELVLRVRGRGGAVVASGGCFDILHAGHISLLERARELGDALVVLLNSDASVTRLKGEGRPVNRQLDRARVLAALRCVDAVIVFDDDDPVAALRDLRPDVWVKGGDYVADGLPETPVVLAGGGRVEILPLLEGRSTTSILRRSAP